MLTVWSVRVSLQDHRLLLLACYVMAREGGRAREREGGSKRRMGEGRERAVRKGEGSPEGRDQGSCSK